MLTSTVEGPQENTSPVDEHDIDCLPNASKSIVNWSPPKLAEHDDNSRAVNPRTPDLGQDECEQFVVVTFPDAEDREDHPFQGPPESTAVQDRVQKPREDAVGSVLTDKVMLVVL